MKIKPIKCCSCMRCRMGRNKTWRKLFNRKLRRKLKHDPEFFPLISSTYTD